jgi:hypothetical protein
VAVAESFRSDSFEPHNVCWKSVFGIGFSAASWYCYLFSHQYIGDSTIGLVGTLISPVVVTLIIFLVSRRVLCTSRHSRLIWGAAFLLSLFVCVGHDAANYLALHHVPLFWNYSAVWY